MKLNKNTEPTTTDSKDRVSITNSSGTNLHVLNSFNESEKLLKTVYENTLTLFSTIENKKIVEDKQTVSIKLIGNTFTYDGKTLPGFSYHLLFAEPTTYFPISIAYVSNLDGSYGSITVTEKDKKKLKESAWSFYQRILAYPASDFTLDFLQAQKESAQLGNVDAINAYFQATKSYKNLDFESVYLLMSYMGNYAGAWIKNQSKFTFYLYSSLDKEKPLKLQEPVLIGRLEFTKQDFSSPTIDLTKGYTISFKDDSGTDTPVEFIRGLFREESLFLNLAPGLMPKSRLNGNIKEDEIIPFVYGQINGISVVGIEKKIVPNEPISLGSPYAFWSFDSFAKLVAAAVIGGIICLAIYKTAKFVHARIQIRNRILSETTDNQLEEEYIEERGSSIEDASVLNGGNESVGNESLALDMLRQTLDLHDTRPLTSSGRAEAIGGFHKSIMSSRYNEYQDLSLEVHDLLKQYLRLRGGSREISKLADDFFKQRITFDELNKLEIDEFMKVLQSKHKEMEKIHQQIQSEALELSQDIQERLEKINEPLVRLREGIDMFLRDGKKNPEETKVKGLGIEENGEGIDLEDVVIDETVV